MNVVHLRSGFGNASGASGMTPFERDVTIAFEIHKNNPSASHICVALRYDIHSPHGYTDAQTQTRIPASVDIFALGQDEDPAQTVQVMGIYKDPIVIMLDLRGPALAEQIPNWRPGTIHYPATFVASPAINMRNETLAQQPPAPRRMFGVIDGGLSP